MTWKWREPVSLGRPAAHFKPTRYEKVKAEEDPRVAPSHPPPPKEQRLSPKALVPS